MTKFVYTISAVMLIGGLPFAAHGQVSDQATVTASAEIIAQDIPLALQVSNNIEFGQVVVPTATGSLCQYFVNSFGGAEHSYFDGTTTQIANSVCEFQSSDQAVSEVSVNCKAWSGVVVSATYTSAGAPGITFSDGNLINRSYPVYSVSNGIRTSIDQNPTTVCGTDDSMTIEIGGQLSLSPDAAPGTLQVGSVVIDASYQ